MALEFYRALDCLEYVGHDPKIPALRVELREPVHERGLTLTAPVDTGFAGHILLDRAAYEHLGTAELPREQFGTYGTMAGPVVLRRSRVILLLGGKEFESYVETPLHGVGKLLLGRSVLSKLDLAFLGSAGRCCYLKAEKAE